MPASRASWPSLTLRGRAFAAAGGTILLCAVVLGQDTLVRIGALVLVLPVLSWLLIGFRRQDVSARRLVARPVVPAGSATSVDLLVTSTGRDTVEVEDQIPYALGSRPRFVLDRTQGEQRMQYQVRSDVRGKYELGPLATRVTDPFGLIELRHVVPGTASVIVTPRVVPLPAIVLGGGRTGSGERSVPHIAAGSAEDVTVREYRRGDDLRRVHWRSSARVGQLMVRREEHPWEARATVLLDNRIGAHAGRGPSSSLETAIMAAASVAVHLDARGYAVRLVTADGPAGPDAEPVSVLLERLAVVGRSWRADLDTTWCGESARVGNVVAVLGAVAARDAGALRRIHHASGHAAAIVVDVDQWGASPQTGPSAHETLRGIGWRIAAVGRTVALDQAWRDLDVRARAAR